jgi:hypothetical protein
MTLDNPSIADLRGALDMPAGEPAEPVKESPAETETEQAAEPAVDEKEQEQEEPLPRGVEKRIAKEVARQAELDRKISEAVASTKAKEAGLAKIAGKSGSDPSTTAPAKTGKPERPEFKDGETWAQHLENVRKYEDAREEWTASEVRKQVQAEFEQKAADDAMKAKWDQAIKVHGDKFQSKVDAVIAASPVPFQKAVGDLDNWHGVAVALADSPEKLADLVAIYKTNPHRGIAALGVFEKSLEAPTKSPGAAALPKPPSKVGGKSSPSEGTIDLQTVGMSQFKAAVNRSLGRTG